MFRDRENDLRSQQEVEDANENEQRHFHLCVCVCVCYTGKWKQQCLKQKEYTICWKSGRTKIKGNYKLPNMKKEEKGFFKNILTKIKKKSKGMINTKFRSWWLRKHVREHKWW